MKETSVGEAPILLGVEGGATRTVAILADRNFKQLKRVEIGPANLKLLDDSHLENLLGDIAGQMPIPDAVAVGLAGNWSEQDCTRILAAAEKVWPGVPCNASNDLETALAAADDISSKWKNRVLVLSGTGSCCFGKDATGCGIKVGSGGHVVADIGSAFQLSVEALRGVFARFEETGRWPDLGGRLLRALQFNEPDDLIGWANTTTKSELSRLAPEVLAAWVEGDAIAGRVAEKAARQLARQAIICAKRLKYFGRKITFVLSGSVLLKQLKFQKTVGAELRRLCPGCAVVPLKRESAWGAVELARRLCNQNKEGRQTLQQPSLPIPTTEGLPSTEERNPSSLKLDKLAISEAIELMLSEEACVPKALLACRTDIEAAIRLMVQRLRRRGRLFYIGAGTSGRLGVLDASECPPTFRTPPDMVQGIIAGGVAALWQSLEGAEDDFAGGMRAIASRNLKRSDVLVGIAASGSTPFVWGAFAHARQIGAATILVTFNPRLKIPTPFRPQVVIAPDVGPEILTGSTRLKAGTATKLLLNMFTTLSMVRLGKVRSNLMIDVNPSNVKLRGRAVRIVSELTGKTPEEATAALEQSGWVVNRALNVAPTGKRI